MAKGDQDLREQCLDEALRIIRRKGVEQLSLREVARRLRVSHQAPYRHFGSKEELLAEVIRRGFVQLNAELAPSEEAPSAEAALIAMGHAYLRFALRNPLLYRLMFTRNAEIDGPPDEEGRRAFAFLVRKVAEYTGVPLEDGLSLEADAVFVWSTLHGLSTILQSEAAVSQRMLQCSIEQIADQSLQRMLAGLGMRLE